MQANEVGPAPVETSPSNYDESANAVVLHQETPERLVQGGGLAYGGGDKYSQLTRLNDEDENVDFLRMFQQYQMTKGQEEIEDDEDEQIDMAEHTGEEVIVDDDERL